MKPMGRKLIQRELMLFSHLKIPGTMAHGVCPVFELLSCLIQCFISPAGKDFGTEECLINDVLLNYVDVSG